jgi:hypothetical protein
MPDSESVDGARTKYVELPSTVRSHPSRVEPETLESKNTIANSHSWSSPCVYVQTAVCMVTARSDRHTIVTNYEP